MMNLTTALNNNRIYATSHAVKRFKERFRKQYWHLLNQFSPESVIIGQLKGAVECIKWKQSPFYVNKVGTIHETPNTVVYKRGPVYYVCVPKGNSIKILTVVDRWYCEYE